ncbi:inorganic phosphate transporter [Ecytonucleospora hepatopenaei]|uniref:Inorganic phosphate transporter n=1 Tax=Ecytonucleospora hepatopenaei TaxID=646526 RepID=A0A1W0E2V7_9MICR|nr:inorganic phosphate transporter [Ecytonucleospora hepatopenaei]
MGYGNYIKNNEVHEWSDYYVKYNRVLKSIGSKGFNEKITNEVNKVNKFYSLLEGKAIEEGKKILMDMKGEISEKEYMEGMEIYNINYTNNNINSNNINYTNNNVNNSNNINNNINNNNVNDTVENSHFLDEIETYEQMENIHNTNEHTNNYSETEHIDYMDREYTDDNITDIESDTNTINTDIKSNTKNITNNNTNTNITDYNFNYDIPDNKYNDNKYNDNDNNQLGVLRYITMPRMFVRRKREKHITEFLHSLIKIKTYRDINITAITKLIKKHESKIKKNTLNYNSNLINSNNLISVDVNILLKQKYFYKSKVCDKIKKFTKKLYKSIFAKNNPGKAKRTFAAIRRGFMGNDATYLFAGLVMGVNSVLAAYKWPNALFFAVNNIFLGFLLFGLCIKIFKSYKINYKFIFNFDYDSSLNNGRYLLIISLFNLGFIVINQVVVSFVSINGNIVTNNYMESVNGENYAVRCVGAIYLLFCFIILFMPIRVFFVNSRLYLVSSLLRGLFNPISTIRFRHFYFLDVLQSFNFTYGILLNVVSVKRILYHSILLSYFPLIRFLQCIKRYTKSKLIFPHIFNGGKYLLVILALTVKVVYKESANKKILDNYTITTLKWSAFCVHMVSSICSMMWDVFVDFSIFRTSFMFPKIFYAYIILFDILCRLTWTYEYILPESILGEYKWHYALSFALTEILRRFLWTLVRVEVEHLNNCDELKQSKAVKLTTGELFYKKDQEVIQNKFANFSKTNSTTVDESSATTETKASHDIQETTTFDTTTVEA